MGRKHVAALMRPMGTGLLKYHGTAISMDGKGCWRDNVFIERLWKLVEHEDVYLRAYDSVSHARVSLRRYFDFYNQCKPHLRLIAAPLMRSTLTNRCLGRRQLDPVAEPPHERSLDSSSV